MVELVDLRAQERPLSCASRENTLSFSAHNMHHCLWPPTTIHFTYTVAQKVTKLLINRNPATEIRLFFVRLKCQTSTILSSVITSQKARIKYSKRDVIRYDGYVNYCP